MQEAYKALEVKHEEFLHLIEDHNEFEEQEAWLAESQHMFMSLEIHAKLHLESTEHLERKFPLESQFSDNENRLKNLRAVICKNRPKVCKMKKIEIFQNNPKHSPR